MIAYLKGKIKFKSSGFIIIDVGGVGYQVFIASTLGNQLSLGQELELYTHQHVREDEVNLYGFIQPDELELFELLIGISGIGPRTALGILSIAGPDDVKESIGRGDYSLLVKVSGIGRKTAERVVLELREKIGKLAGRSLSAGSFITGDELDALMALGYSLAQAREALNGVDKNIKDAGERIRQALKKLGK